MKKEEIESKLSKIENVFKLKKSKVHKYNCVKVNEGLHCEIDDMSIIIKINDVGNYYETLTKQEFATVIDIENYIFKLIKDKKSYQEDINKGIFP